MACIQTVIDSLRHLNLEPNTPIILSHDYSNHPDYLQYLHCLRDYVQQKPEFQIVTRDTHGHLTGNVRNALQYVNTPYVMVLQHDMPFISSFSVSKVMEDLEAHPELQIVRFNKRANIKAGWDGKNSLFGLQIQSHNYTYTRTPTWSDNNHISRKDYYDDIVMPECFDGKPMELHFYNRITTPEVHKKYGTFIFGPLGQSAMVSHLDGRRSKSIQELQAPLCPP